MSLEGSLLPDYDRMPQLRVFGAARNKLTESTEFLQQGTRPDQMRLTTLLLSGNYLVSRLLQLTSPNEWLPPHPAFC